MISKNIVVHTSYLILTLLLISCSDKSSKTTQSQSPQPQSSPSGSTAEPKNIDPALAALINDVKADPQNYNKYNKLGLYFMDKRMFNDARKAFLLAQKINPNDAETLNYLAASDARLGNFDEAIEQFKKAIDLNPLFFEASENLAAVLSQKGQIQESRDVFANLLKKHPDSARLHNSFGVLFAMQKDYSNAESEWKKALAIDPNLDSAKKNLERLKTIQKS